MGSNPGVVKAEQGIDLPTSLELSEDPANGTERGRVVPDTVKPGVKFGTQPLADFLNVVGNCVADLNTIAVGLAAIGQTHQKPEGLNINWAPKDPLIAARKARKAAIHGAMVVTVEALAQYVRAVTKLPRFAPLISEWALRDKVKKVSGAEKFSDLADLLLVPICPVDGHARYASRFKTCCVMLLIHWRNRHVHIDSSATLKHHEKQFIRAEEMRIFDEYAGLKIDRLLSDFDINRPTLKEATTLIAMTIQQVRALDSAVYLCADAVDVQAWLDHYELNEKIDKIRRESAPEKQNGSILQMLQTHVPYLRPWYEKFM